MKKVIVEVEKYEATDGKVFDTESDCELHERRLKGEIRTCKECHGSKKIINEDGTGYSRCMGCNGKGYQEKHIVWK